MKNIQKLDGFSLVEILCVIAITVTLAAVAVGSIGPMIDQSKSVECLSNMRQVGAAMHLYLGENNGRLPSSSHDSAPDGSSLSWTNTLAAYLGEDFIGRCPDQKSHPARITYGWNDLLTDISGAGITAVICRQPGSTIALAELAQKQTSEHMHFRGSIRNGRLTANQFRGYVNTTCHGRGANYLFVDGRVENLPWTEVQRRVTSPNSIFINP